MADKITFELVSPERLLLSVEADMVTVPGAEGDFGVLPGHAPLISSLRPGVIVVEGAADWDDRIFVAGGVAEVAADRLTVLAEEAYPVRSLDRATIEQKLQDAREDLDDATDEEARRKAAAMIAHLEDLARAAG
jgi:F-type H+-transporting ATPase subunit epsilon